MTQPRAELSMEPLPRPARVPLPTVGKVSAPQIPQKGTRVPARPWPQPRDTCWGERANAWPVGLRPPQ